MKLPNELTAANCAGTTVVRDAVTAVFDRESDNRLLFPEDNTYM